MTEKLYPVRVLTHKSSDLLVAMIPEIPGFIVHAYSVDELEEKLGPAFKEFMDATDRPIDQVEVIKDEAPAGFFPPALAAKAIMDKQAA